MAHRAIEPTSWFTGYDEGTVPFEPDTIIATPVLHARLFTSRLAGDFGATWDAMDGGQAPEATPLAPDGKGRVPPLGA